MTKLRSNHRRSSRGSGFMARLILMTVLLILGIFAFGYFLLRSDALEDNALLQKYQTEVEYVDGSERYYLPTGDDGQVVHHTYYSLSYNEDLEIPNWVAYILTKKDLLIPNVKRSDRFEKDPLVKTKSAAHSDYTRSGYTRGHIAPAGDMAFSRQAMDESFYMSNMCPQISAFNGGIWRELEEQVRDWAYDYEKLVVVSGPILRGVNQYIGQSRVGVPNSFYKVLLDLEAKDPKALAFIIPHEKSEKRLQSYAVSVDQVESETGLDLFSDLMDDVLEEKIESTVQSAKWNFDEKRYRMRVESWNNR